MNKIEAIKAMNEGKKVTHRNFLYHEWITMNDDSILFEDGLSCSQYEFWKYRTDESWNEDWEIFNCIT